MAATQIKVLVVLCSGHNQLLVPAELQGFMYQLVLCFFSTLYPLFSQVFLHLFNFFPSAYLQCVFLRCYFLLFCVFFASFPRICLLHRHWIQINLLFLFLLCFFSALCFFYNTIYVLLFLSHDAQENVAPVDFGSWLMSFLLFCSVVFGADFWLTKPRRGLFCLHHFCFLCVFSWWFVVILFALRFLAVRHPWQISSPGPLWALQCLPHVPPHITLTHYANPDHTWTSMHLWSCVCACY